MDHLAWLIAFILLTNVGMIGYVYITVRCCPRCKNLREDCFCTGDPL